MDEGLVSVLVSEMREDFQIPPFISDATIERYINEGYYRLDKLNPDRDIVTDLNFRSLLKSYGFYAYNHKTAEFYENYASEILSWQMEAFNDETS